MSSSYITERGGLDTDPHGSVLMTPRTGSVSVSFNPSLAEYTGELLVIAVWANEADQEDEEDKKDYVLPPEIGQALGLEDVLNEVVADAEFTAAKGSSTESIRVMGKGVKRIALYGLGKKSKGGGPSAGAAKFAVKKAMGIKSCDSVGLYVHEAGVDDVALIAEGANIGGHVDERYKEKKDTEKVPSELVAVGISSSAEMTGAVKRGVSIATGVITTKELINAPANVLTPATMAIAAETIAKEEGLGIEILGRAKCEELGMGSYLGVGRGSTDEPKFIHMWYKPEGDVKKKICLVGKSVTFDTGGTNLKVGASMIELMKFDMGGGAVCLGTAKAVGALKPEGVEVHFIMPAVENMLGDKSIHPGDILKASTGKTIEVINTDAEGRLTLADGVAYAENLGDVDYIVDLATLTGAIIVSLGHELAGYWSESEELSDMLMASSKAVGEKLWRMPIVEEYKEGLKSKVADLRNVGTGRAGGSITAAMFIREFVKTKNWAHVDIAGTTWDFKEGAPTGYGVKLMTNWVESFVGKE